MANRIYQIKAKIVCNVHIISNYYKLTLNTPEIAQVARPGQFVMLRVSGDYQLLLRRPFSIHSVSNQPQPRRGAASRHSGISPHAGKAAKPSFDYTQDGSASVSEAKPVTGNQIQIIYEVVGKGTKILSEKKPGEYLDVLGPLGNGFDLTPNTYNLTPILVGGGIGIAPLLFLAEQLTTYDLQLTTVLIGAKTKKEILSQKEFVNLGLSVKISTDDGSAGFKGKVTELLKNILRTPLNARHKTLRQTRRRAIYACGPKPMFGEIAIISKQYNIPAQISFDEYMACGLGVCLGCMVKTEGGYQAVCKEGPVFDSIKIIF